MGIFEMMLFPDNSPKIVQFPWLFPSVLCCLWFTLLSLLFCSQTQIEKKKMCRGGIFSAKNPVFPTKMTFFEYSDISSTNLVMYTVLIFPLFFTVFFCFVLLAAGMKGGEEGERRGVTVTVFRLIGYWCCYAGWTTFIITLRGHGWSLANFK